MIIRKYGIMLERLTQKDLELVRQKRNDDSIRSFMFYQKKISKKEQEIWFESINNIHNYYFIIHANQKKVGLISGKKVNYQEKTSYGGIFLWERGPEVSLLASKASIIMIEIIFKLFGFKATFAEIKKSNTSQIAYNKMLGYVQFSEHKEDNKLEFILTKEAYSKKGNKIRKIIGKLTKDEHDISWDNIDFSNIPKEAIPYLYKGLPKDIQEIVDKKLNYN